MIQINVTFQVMGPGNNSQQIFVSFAESPKAKIPFGVVIGEGRAIQREISNFVSLSNLLI